MHIPRLLLLAGSFLFFTSALVYWPFLVRVFHPVSPERAGQMHWIQLFFLITAAAFYWLSRSVTRPGMLRTLFQKSTPPKMLLCLLVLMPFFIAEISLRPFINLNYRWTTIFIPDERLGWKFKPNTQDRWGNIVMHINNKGLRGAELPYQKPEGTLRILFLGDSVTAGYKIAKMEQTFPYLTEKMLQRAIPARVEAVNAGVDGYSPWQQMLYLEQEGIRYDPDLIVIGFVLNDVTERFTLRRFGGASQGTQLTWTISPPVKWLIEHSSIAFTVHSRSMYGRYNKENMELARKLEVLSLKSLVQQPDSPQIQYAWKKTLDDLQKILDFCAARRISVLLVAFPYDFQFQDIRRNSVPQRVLAKFAGARQIPFLDLLPLMAKRTEMDRLTTADLFLDESGHLSPLGNQLVAELLASFILREQVLKSGSERANHRHE